MAATWAASVVDRLIELRADGYDFQRAWTMAMRMYPPRGRDAGEATPRLFDEGGGRPETLMSFFRRACEAAWNDAPNRGGQPAKVRQFRREIALDETDEASPSRRSTSSHGRYRAA